MRTFEEAYYYAVHWWKDEANGIKSPTRYCPPKEPKVAKTKLKPLQDTYGYWTVLGREGTEVTVQCVCGKVKTFHYYRLGKTESCGCQSNRVPWMEDLTGREYHAWTVVEYVGRSRWSCRCVCGNMRDIKRASLVKGQSKSCGCLTDHAANGATRKVEQDQVAPQSSDVLPVDVVCEQANSI